MKSNYIKFAMGVVCSAALTLSSCSDIDLPSAANNNLAPIPSVEQSVNGRTVTLTWSAVSGATGYKVYCNQEEVADLDASQLSFSAICSYNKELIYTVKYYIKKDPTAPELLMSMGCSVTVFVEAPDIPTGGDNMVGYVLTATDYTKLPDDDEVTAAEWFYNNYVVKGTGAFIQAEALSEIKPDKYPALWVHIDRVGIGYGVANLPFKDEEIEYLEKYAKAGGNIYLSKHATQLTTAIHRIEAVYAPGIFGDGEGGPGNDVWCVNNIIGVNHDYVADHRKNIIFNDIEYTDPNNYGFPNFGIEGPGELREDHNCMWDLNTYGFTGEPNTVVNWEEATNSTVLATWGHVQDYCCAGIVEFDPISGFDGKIIANGLSAYEFNQKGGNSYQANLELLTANILDYLRGALVPKAAYLLLADDYTQLPDDDEVAAAEWFYNNYVLTGTGAFVKPSELPSLSINKFPVVWVQIDRVGMGYGLDKLPLSGDDIAKVGEYLKKGGNLYLSKHATQIIAGVGRTEYAPGIFGDGEGGGGNDVWCVNNIIGVNHDWVADHRDHKIYAGIEYTDPNNYGFPNFGIEGPGELREDHNCMWDLNTYGFSGVPNTVVNWEEATNSVVLGTWGHVQDYCCAGIVEFEPTGEFAGTSICNGLSAYEFNQKGGNTYQDNLELLTANIINYLMKK